MAEEKYKKYILFDLDGTLTDPKIGICTCVQYALKSFGIDEPDLDKLEPFIGPPLLDSFRDFYGFSEEDCKKASAKYRERYSTEGMFENKVYPGIKHMLKTLKKNGFHISVASSKPQVFVEKIMEHFGLAKYFDAMVGSNLDGTRTDKAEIIDEALKQLFGKNKVDLEQVYMVGDRKFDCIGAQKKGVECVAVAYGYGDFDELMDARADYIVFSPKELEEFLMRQTFKASQGRVCRKKGDGIVPIPIKSILLLLAATAGMLILRSGIEMGLQVIAIEIVFILPRGILDWLLYSSMEGNGNSFGFIGNLGTIITALSYIIAVAPFIYPAIYYIKSTKKDSNLLHPMVPSVWQIILGVVMIIALTMSVQVTATLINIANSSDSYKEVARIQYSCSFVVGLIVYGILTPMAEELIFRGVVYGVFRRYLPIPIAMVLTSVLFGLYHGNIVQGVYAFVFGCLMIWVYEYFGTFWAAYAVHALANTVTYVASKISLTHDGFICWPVAAGMLVFGAAAIVMLVRLRVKINTPEKNPVEVEE